MNIIILSPPLGYRGSENFVANCAATYRSMDVSHFGDGSLEVTIMSSAKGNDVVYETLLKQKFRILQYQSEQEFHALLDEELGSRPPAFVHLHRGGWYNRAQAGILRKLHDKHIPIIETNIFGRLDYFTGQLIDVHLHISKWDLIRWNYRKRHIPQARTQFGVYLPYCLDSSVFKPQPESAISSFKRKHDIPSDAFVIGRLGKTDWKTLGYTIPAVLSKHKNVCFVTVEDYSCPINLIQSWPAPVQNQIRIIPKLKDKESLSAFYSSCSVTLATSGIGESFGFGIAESMSCGTPVVSISRPHQDNAQTELIDHGQTGFVAGSSKALLSLLMHVIDSPETLSWCRERCRGKIQHEYDCQAVANRLEVLVAAILSENGVFSRSSLIQKLKRDFIWQSCQTPLCTYSRLKANSFPPTSIKDLLSMLWRWNPFLFFVYERLRVLIKGTP